MGTLKDIVQEIIKIAESPGEGDDLPRRKTPKKRPVSTEPAKKPVPSDIPLKKAPTAVVPKQTQSFRSNEIMEMQNAIKAFSKEVTNYKSSPVIGAGGKVISPTPTPEQQKANPDPQKDFNDFVTNTYLNKASLKGVEIYSSPLTEKWEDKIKSDYVDMDIVMKNLQHIGAGKFELKSDGAWGPRTNNALKTLYAFAESLVKIQPDFKVRMDPKFVFSSADLSNFNSLLIPDNQIRNPKLQQIKVKNATKLTPLIDKLTGFYKSYSKTVLESPKYKPLIQGTQPLHQIPLGGKDPAKFNAEDEDIMRDESKMKEKALRGILMSVKGSNYTVPEMNLVFLQTPELFANYIVRHLGYTQEQANDPKLQSQILNYILTHVDIVINQISSQLKGPPKGPMSQPHM